MIVVNHNTEIAMLRFEGSPHMTAFSHNGRTVSDWLHLTSICGRSGALAGSACGSSSRRQVATRQLTTRPRHSTPSSSETAHRNATSKWVVSYKNGATLAKISHLSPDRSDLALYRR
ncbi:hypothetical protein PHMEG_0007555 [Phytophthora megakarya]|uniref:Uncharacterized protein n=1 Tax=Phytophthora megakarya TaxID=4795 RepID=A0A225WN90_9STRA|nr:hypothetical protein PHMEG_0007555 [Phytophthora megakarya]